jgi:hypothetical protein
MYADPLVIVAHALVAYTERLHRLPRGLASKPVLSVVPLRGQYEV